MSFALHKIVAVTILQCGQIDILNDVLQSAALPLRKRFVAYNTIGIRAHGILNHFHAVVLQNPFEIHVSAFHKIGADDFVIHRCLCARRQGQQQDKNKKNAFVFHDFNFEFTGCMELKGS